MVRRIYVEKKPHLRQEAAALLSELRDLLGIAGLSDLRIVNRYDVEGLDEADFTQAVQTVFSEPQVDDVTEELPEGPHHTVFAVEPLPGQFDQRSDSAAQCIQMMTQGERPTVRTAKVYLLEGEINPSEVERIKRYLINPVEAREAALEPLSTLSVSYPLPDSVQTVTGFTGLNAAGLASLLDQLGLAMDLDDLEALQRYFREEERRDPTITEIRVVDTYWSDHCRHTTFSTHLDQVEIEDPEIQAAYDRYLAAREEVYGTEKAAARPQTLMDLATLGAKVLKKRGLLPELDESEEINACSIRIPAVVDGAREDWLLMFKNETHNHPTEIEPFGGAATCIGGCIRDPLSGRAYVHQAMRVTGAGDPRTPLRNTLTGKLPQRKLCQTAAAGYSSYGNQIGLATGLVAEVYHEGYVAKRLECGAVVGAAPAEHVIRERPVPGDVVLLLGGRTGRDGIGGATGSSKSHDLKSLDSMASEVQKGNPPEERKLQRLFRKGEVTRLIKRCNDFGAGGVSVAIGELADGLEINLDAVRRKYDGLDGTELAISESQERMAVVVSPDKEAAFLAAAEEENLEAYRVAVVTEAPRMVMRWKGKVIADLSRAFLNTNGAEKHASAFVGKRDRKGLSAPMFSSLREMAASLKCASRRGLIERFDSTIGAGSVLMPFGGRFQRTPEQVMAALLPVAPGRTSSQASVMAWAFDPERMSMDPYQGAYDAVISSAAKLVAAGADPERIYLSLQEFFEKLREEPERWGKPLSALLGALDAQLALGAAAIGGKDSMSGTFLERDVPPTLISFAIAPVLAENVISSAMQSCCGPVYLFSREEWGQFRTLCREGKVRAARAVEYGLAECVMKMSFGNSVGFRALEGNRLDWFSAMPGTVVAQVDGTLDDGILLGWTTMEPVMDIGTERVPVEELLSIQEHVLEEIYPTRAGEQEEPVPLFKFCDGPAVGAPAVRHVRPKALIPVFPGTNCEYDTQRALLDAGAEAEILVVRNLSASDVSWSVKRFAEALDETQMVVIPGGFSGGDEPDGAAKFITAFFRSPAVREGVTRFLQRRDGLMLGICNGFQALVKLGLVPYGKILEPDENAPTLTYNTIGRHQSMLVYTRVCSNLSPWLAAAKVGDVYTVPVSHGEGRFLCSEAFARQLAQRGQIATQYVDVWGNPSMKTEVNPNGSVCAIEGITSPDGRVFGKMGHSERVGKYLYRNVPGRYEMGLFQSAVQYFSPSR